MVFICGRAKLVDNFSAFYDKNRIKRLSDAGSNADDADETHECEGGNVVLIETYINWLMAGWCVRLHNVPPVRTYQHKHTHIRAVRVHVHSQRLSHGAVLLDVSAPVPRISLIKTKVW